MISIIILCTTLTFAGIAATTCNPPLPGCTCTYSAGSGRYTGGCTLTGNYSELPNFYESVSNYTFSSYSMRTASSSSAFVALIGPRTFAGLKAISLTLSGFLLGTLDPDAFLDIDQSITTLSITNINIEEIPDGFFRNMTLLRSLTITGTNVATLKSGMFIGIKLLTLLNLSGNKIAVVQHGAFAMVPAVTTLVLSNNKLTSISDVGLASLTSLTTVIFSNNPVQLESSTFNSTALTTLTLDQTSVTSIPKDVFVVEPSQSLTISLIASGIVDLRAILSGGSGFIYSLPTSVKKVQLSYNLISNWLDETEFNFSSVPSAILNLTGNPLTCDCVMASSRQEFNRIVSSSISLTCSSPASVANKRVLCFDPRQVPCPYLSRPCDYDPYDFQWCAAVDHQIKFPISSPPSNITSVYPLSSPAYGGTKFLIYGSGFNSVAIKSVFFGNSSLAGEADNGLSTVDQINITTPKSYIVDELLPISLEYCNGVVLNTGFNFNFTRPTPVITNIYPTVYLTSGGIEMNVTMLYLDWIQTQPELQLSISSISGKKSTIIEACTVEVSTSSVTCIVPAFNWLKPVNVSVSFILGDLVAFPPTDLQFLPPPTFHRTLVKFDASSKDSISITGMNLLRGCRESDYSVMIGNAVCSNLSISQNRLNCTPPSSPPQENENPNCADNQLTVTITIGYATFQPACIDYSTTSTEKTAGESSPCKKKSKRRRKHRLCKFKYTMTCRKRVAFFKQLQRLRAKFGWVQNYP